MQAMQWRKCWIAAVVTTSMVAGVASIRAAEDGRFEKLSVYLERNLRDRDAEIRFEVTGTEEGLVALRAFGPDAREVIDFRTPDSKFGIRSLMLESPEPADEGAAVKTAFPAGNYRFEATSTDGSRLRGEVWLSHVFPEPARLEYPRPGQDDVPTTALTLRWSVPDGIVSCAIAVEQAGSPYEIQALLPAAARAFTIPEGFLRAGQTYKVAIGTVAKDGNRSFIEAAFTTERAR